MSPRLKGERSLGLPQARQQQQRPPQQRQRQQQQLHRRDSSSRAMTMLRLTRKPLPCQLFRILPMMLLTLHAAGAMVAAAAGVAAEQCRPQAKGYSVLYGMQPPQPTAVQYWDRTASGVKVGRVRQVSVYFDAATECIAGVRVTYGNKPGVSHLMGTERGPGYVERLLVLDLDENINSVDVMYDARCIRLLRWHTDSGRAVAAGSPDSAGSIHMATAVPMPNSWRLVSVRGTYGPGTLNSLQFAWGPVSCQEVADAGQQPKQAHTAASKPAGASSGAKHARAHQAAQKHAASPLITAPTPARRQSQQPSALAVPSGRQQSAGINTVLQQASEEAPATSEAEPAAAQEAHTAETLQPRTTHTSKGVWPASPHQTSKRHVAGVLSTRQASQEHAGELAASSDDDDASEWAVDGTPEDAAETGPGVGTSKQQEPGNDWDEGTGDAEAQVQQAALQQSAAPHQGGSSIRTRTQALQRHTKAAAAENGDHAASSGSRSNSKPAPQTWRASAPAGSSAEAPAAAEPSDDGSDEAALAARVIAKAVQKLRQQQSEQEAEEDAVSLDTDVSALLQKALHPPPSDIAALQASGLLPQGFLDAAEEADRLATATKPGSSAARQTTPEQSQQRTEAAGQASSGLQQQQEPAKVISKAAASPAPPAGTSDVLFPASPRWLPQAPAAPLAVSSGAGAADVAEPAAAQPAPTAQSGPQGSSSTVPAPPPAATAADADVLSATPGSSQAGSTAARSSSSSGGGGGGAFRAVVPPAVSCTAVPERCSTAKALGEAGFCAAVAPLTQPECVGGCCVSMGKCGSSSCTLSGLGGDVAGLRCNGLNNGMVPDSGDGTLCQNLACRLAVPGCQKAAATASGGAGGGSCVGKVVALGPATKTHPAAMQLVGFPCLDVAPSSAQPLTIHGDHSARGHYVAGGWGVCNCDGTLPASLAGIAPLVAAAINNTSGSTPAASSPSAAPAPQQQQQQQQQQAQPPGAAVAALGRQVVAQLAPNGITAQQLQAAIVSALGTGDAAAVAASSAAAQQLVAAAAAAGLLLPAGSNVSLPAGAQVLAASPSTPPEQPGSSQQAVQQAHAAGAASAAAGGAAGSSDRAATAGEWLQQLAAVATGGMGAAAAQQNQAQAGGAGGATGSPGRASWLSDFLAPSGSNGVSSSSSGMPVQVASNQAAVTAGPSSALAAVLQAAPQPPAFPAAPAQLLQAGAAGVQVPTGMWLPHAMAGSMGVHQPQQQIYPNQVLMQQQQQQRPGVATMAGQQLPYQAAAAPQLQQRPPPVMLGQLASQPYVQVLPIAGPGGGGAPAAGAGSSAAIRPQDLQQQPQQQSGAQQLGSGLMNLLSAFVTAASKQQHEQEQQPEQPELLQQAAEDEGAGSSEPAMSEADEIAAAALADAHVAYAPASSGQQPRYDSQRGAYATQPVEVAASTQRYSVSSSSAGRSQPDTEVSAEGVFAMPGAPADPRRGARAATNGRRAAVVGPAGRAAVPRASAPTYISNRYAASSSSSSSSSSNQWASGGGGGGRVWTAAASPAQQQQQQQPSQAQQPAGEHQRARRHARRGGGPSVQSVDESDYNEVQLSSHSSTAAAAKQQQMQQQTPAAASNATQSVPAQPLQHSQPPAAGTASTPATALVGAGPTAAALPPLAPTR